MSGFIGGIDNYVNNAMATAKINSTNRSAGSASMDMTDFLTLMVEQFQNQDIENAASTSDMLNQLVQMSVMQAVTNITDATSLMYAASLVGKTVTVGQYDSSGKLAELVGTVSGTGTYNSKPVVFVDGQTYYLSDILAVGTLPGVGGAAETQKEHKEIASVIDAQTEKGTEAVTETQPETETEAVIETQPETETEAGSEAQTQENAIIE